MPLELGGHRSPPRYSHTWVALVLWMCSSAFLFNTGLAGAAETITLTAPKEPARADDSFVRLFPGLPPFARQLTRCGKRRASSARRVVFLTPRIS
jgi:hypothetical protein